MDAADHLNTKSSSNSAVTTVTSHLTVSRDAFIIGNVVGSLSERGRRDDTSFVNYVLALNITKRILMTFNSEQDLHRWLPDIRILDRLDGGKSSFSAYWANTELTQTLQSGKLNFVGISSSDPHSLDVNRYWNHSSLPAGGLRHQQEHQQRLHQHRQSVERRSRNSKPDDSIRCDNCSHFQHHHPHQAEQYTCEQHVSCDVAYLPSGFESTSTSSNYTSSVCPERSQHRHTIGDKKSDADLSARCSQHRTTISCYNRRNDEKRKIGAMLSFKSWLSNRIFSDKDDKIVDQSLVISKTEDYDLSGGMTICKSESIVRCNPDVHDCAHGDVKVSRFRRFFRGQQKVKSPCTKLPNTPSSSNKDAPIDLQMNGYSTANISSRSQSSSGCSEKMCGPYEESTPTTSSGTDDYVYSSESDYRSISDYERKIVTTDQSNCSWVEVGQTVQGLAELSRQIDGIRQPPADLVDIIDGMEFLNPRLHDVCHPISSQDDAIVLVPGQDDRDIHTTLCPSRRLNRTGFDANNLSEMNNEPGNRVQGEHQDCPLTSSFTSSRIEQVHIPSHDADKLSHCRPIHCFDLASKPQVNIRQIDGSLVSKGLHCFEFSIPAYDFHFKFFTQSDKESQKWVFYIASSLVEGHHLQSLELCIREVKNLDVDAIRNAILRNCLLEEEIGRNLSLSVMCEVWIDGELFARTHSEQISSYVTWNENFRFTLHKAWNTLRVDIIGHTDYVVNHIADSRRTHSSRRHHSNPSSLLHEKTGTWKSGLILRYVHPGRQQLKYERHTGNVIPARVQSPSDYGHIGLTHKPIWKMAQLSNEHCAEIRACQPAWHDDHFQRFIISNNHNNIIISTKLIPYQDVISTFNKWYTMNVGKSKDSIKDYTTTKHCPSSDMSDSVNEVNLCAIERATLDSDRSEDNSMATEVEQDEAYVPSLHVSGWSNVLHISSRFRYARLIAYVKHNYMGLIKQIESKVVMQEVDDLVFCLVDVAIQEDFIVDFLCNIVLNQIISGKNEAALTFRGTNLATKAMETYMRRVGRSYLTEVIEPIIREILKLKRHSLKIMWSSEQQSSELNCKKQLVPDTDSDRSSAGNLQINQDAAVTSKSSPSHTIIARRLWPFFSRPAGIEVDPSRLANSIQLKSNQEKLLCICQIVWSRILSSLNQFPLLIIRVLSSLRENCVDAGINSSIVDNLISSCVFLRFLCPAILSMSLRESVTSSSASSSNKYHQNSSKFRTRTLTLLAKVLQSLANFSGFANKETYMRFMDPFINEQSDNMREFIRVISARDTIIWRRGRMDANDYNDSGSHSELPVETSFERLFVVLCKIIDDHKKKTTIEVDVEKQDVVTCVMACKSKLDSSQKEQPSFTHTRLLHLKSYGSNFTTDDLPLDSLTTILDEIRTCHFQQPLPTRHTDNHSSKSTIPAVQIDCSSMKQNNCNVSAFSNLSLRTTIHRQEPCVRNHEKVNSKQDSIRHLTSATTIVDCAMNDKSCDIFREAQGKEQDNGPIETTTDLTPDNIAKIRKILSFSMVNPDGLSKAVDETSDGVLNHDGDYLRLVNYQRSLGKVNRPILPNIRQICCPVKMINDTCFRSSNKAVDATEPWHQGMNEDASRTALSTHLDVDRRRTIGLSHIENGRGRNPDLQLKPIMPQPVMDYKLSQRLHYSAANVLTVNPSHNQRTILTSDTSIMPTMGLDMGRFHHEKIADGGD